MMYPPSQFQKVLSLHATGKAVSLNPAFKLKTPVTPQVLNGFMSDEAFKRDHSMYMHSRDFLPMPVPASPLLCMIMHNRPLFERYTDSFKTLSMLRIIVQCFALNPYLRNERILKAQQVLLDKTIAMEEQMHKDIEACKDLDEFIVIMEHTTYYRIHTYEECVHDMFDLQVPLDHCLTPTDDAVTVQDASAIPALLTHYFATKQEIRNVRMEKALPEGEEFIKVNYFTLPICLREGNLYKNFLSRQLAQEYYNFIK